MYLIIVRFTKNSFTLLLPLSQKMNLLLKYVIEISDCFMGKSLWPVHLCLSGELADRVDPWSAAPPGAQHSGQRHKAGPELSEVKCQGQSHWHSAGQCRIWTCNRPLFSWSSSNVWMGGLYPHAWESNAMVRLWCHQQWLWVDTWFSF